MTAHISIRRLFMLTLSTTWLTRLLNDGGRSRRVDADRERAYRASQIGLRPGGRSAFYARNIYDTSET